MHQMSQFFRKSRKLVMILWNCTFESQLFHKWLNTGPSVARACVYCRRGYLGPHIRWQGGCFFLLKKPLPFAFFTRSRLSVFPHRRMPCQLRLRSLLSSTASDLLTLLSNLCPSLLLIRRHCDRQGNDLGWWSSATRMLQRRSGEKTRGCRGYLQKKRSTLAHDKWAQMAT